MFYKNYGDTDMKVSAIGFGAMRYNDADVQAGNLEKCAEVALYAHSKGINYFDTAPFYCFDKSEEITGIALSQLKRDSYYISSKTNLNAVGEVVNADTFRKRLETTLTRLNVDYLDFYHLWCMLSLDAYQKQSEALYHFFEQAKSEGLIKNIVFSAHMQGSELEDVIALDKFKGMLIGYNPLNYKFRQSGIEAAYKKGMGVVVMNPLGGGLIPQNPQAFEYLTKGTDFNVAQAALRFVASHKEITVTLAGCTSKEHIDDAVKAVEGLQEKPASEIIKIHESEGMSLNNLCTGCGYCNECPVDIDIPKFMDSYNQKLLNGDIVDRILWHWGIPQADTEKCIACGKCESLCTQHLPIIDRLKEISELKF